MYRFSQSKQGSTLDQPSCLCQLRHKKRTWIFLGLALFCIVLRFPSLTRLNWGADEASQAAEAVIIAHGGLPYRDAATHRPPLQSILEAGVFKLCGDYNIIALRVTHILIVLAILYLIYRLGIYIAGHKASIAGCLLFLIYTTLAFTPGDLYSFHTEWLQVLLTATGMCLLFQKKWVASFLAGICFALAVFTKQPAAFDILAAYVWMLTLLLLPLSINSKSDSKIKIIKSAIFCTAGGFSTTLLFICIAFTYHIIPDVFYYLIDYNTNFYMKGVAPDARFAQRLACFLTISQPFCAGLFALSGLVFFRAYPKRRGAQTRRLICFWSVSALLGSLTSARNFGHYSIPVIVPWTILSCVFFRYAIAGIMRRCRRTLNTKRHDSTSIRNYPDLLLLILLLSIVTHASGIWEKIRIIKNAPFFIHEQTRQCGEYLRTAAATDDSLFVWGYWPQLYVHARMRPASRFVYCNFITGKIPASVGRPDHQDLGLHGKKALRDLLTDLKKNKPKFIADTSPSNLYGYGVYPISDFSELAKYIAQHYQLDSTFPDSNNAEMVIQVYRRMETNQ